MALWTHPVRMWTQSHFFFDSLRVTIYFLNCFHAKTRMLSHPGLVFYFAFTVPLLRCFFILYSSSAASRVLPTTSPVPSGKQ